MPYVSESSEAQLVPFECTADGYPSKVYYLRRGRTRSQRGWRSGPVSNEEQRQIITQAGAHLGREAEIIQAYSRAEYEYLATSSGNRSRVNDRDYSELHYQPGTIEATVFGSTRSALPKNFVFYRTSGCFSVDAVQAAKLPKVPTQSQAQSIAAGRIRNSAPSKAPTDLTRFIGEQKDAGLLLKSANYIPKSPKQAAGSFLNAIFGVAPEVRDLRSLAETAYKSTAIMSDYVRHERMRLRRGGVSDFDHTESIQEYWRIVQGTNLSELTTDGVQSSYYFVTPKTPNPGPYSQSVRTHVKRQLVARSYVRHFATFEYFIMRPSGFMGRLETYRKKAQAVLGEGFTPANAYDLVPYTWLIDWFWDIGGLLHYSQRLADNDMVMSLCGYTIVSDAYVNLALSAEVQQDPDARIVSQNSTGASLRVRTETRRSGNPYSIAPVWNLNSQQLAITAALGISKAAS